MVVLLGLYATDELFAANSRHNPVSYSEDSDPQDDPTDNDEDLE